MSSGYSTTLASIPGLVRWWDFSRLSGLVDGTGISLLPDLSGNGADASQAVGAAQPVFKVGIQNNLSIGRFNGTTQDMSFASTAVTDFTVIIAYQWTGTGAANYMLGGAVQGCLAGGSGTTGFGVLNGGFREATVKPTAWGISIYQNDQLDRDGIETAYNTTGTPASLTLTNLGSRVATLFFAGDIGEIAIYNRKLSPGEISVVSGIERSKWATP